jgi:hypothetical protein
VGEEPETIEVGLANGGVIFVSGAVSDAEKALSDAARSGQSRLAWFTDARSGRAIGINPAQVVSLTAGESAN